MDYKHWLKMGLIGLGIALSLPWVRAGDLKITIPRRSPSTPVQTLNHKGVEAVRKQQYARAKSLFYEAYLLDPGDPFTLNNLGYISELEGDVQRAQQLYELASRQASAAVVADASAPELKGKSFESATNEVSDPKMQINRGNVQAIRMFAQHRAPEAEAQLNQTLTMDQNNPFTLNNLGVAKEAEGDLEGAMKFYAAAAASKSAEASLVTSVSDARGKPVSEVAAANVRRLRNRIAKRETGAAKAALLNLQGVLAINRNAPREGALDFLQAYKIDPGNAFTLNNLGYVAEMDGDLESAQLFYESARRAQKANARVAFATRISAQGQKLSEVAEESSQLVDGRIEQRQAARRREAGPIQLKGRDGQPVELQQQLENQVKPH
jgi:Flp pilus assembly protein TadD